MSVVPPRFAQWLLRHTLPPERYETVAGDLEEIFQLEQLPGFGARAARRWFWRQTLSIVSTRLLRQAARPSLPAVLLAAPRKERRRSAVTCSGDIPQQREGLRTIIIGRERAKRDEVFFARRLRALGLARDTAHLGRRDYS
jgi:hypothetical protein